MTMTKNNQKIKEKFYFDVQLETLVPAIITYRIYAEDPQQALEMVRNAPHTNIKYKLNGKKDIKLTIKDAGSSLIRLVKHLLGR